VALPLVYEEEGMDGESAACDIKQQFGRGEYQEFLVVSGGCSFNVVNRKGR
jgi:hypothetical protein